MKYTVIILGFLSFSNLLFSQITWAPPETRWTYNGQGQIISYIEIITKSDIFVERVDKSNSISYLSSLDWVSK